MLLAVVVEGSLAVIALLLGWWLGINPLASWQFDSSAIQHGVIATVPIFAVFLVCHRYPIGSLRTIRDFLIDEFGPLLNICRWYDLLILALLAGLCEEMLFRGLLQPWLSRWGPTTGLLLSSLLFGLVHFVTATYALFAGLMGVYFGWLMQSGESPNIVVPILVHSLYDYFAFLVVLKTYRSQHPALISPPVEFPDTEAAEDRLSADDGTADETSSCGE